MFILLLLIVVIITFSKIFFLLFLIYILVCLSHLQSFYILALSVGFFPFLCILASFLFSESVSLLG